MNNNNNFAIIWDFDGTLVDTGYKNLRVTRNIIEYVTQKNASNFSALESSENYQIANNRSYNWRELYKREFQLTEDQIDIAGRLWTEYQLLDDTDVYLFDGITEVIRSLGNFPQGIVSQNSRENIIHILEKNNLVPFFKQIIGYEEVGFKNQKPNPYGLLSCIEKLLGSRANAIAHAAECDVLIVRIKE